MSDKWSINAHDYHVAISYLKSTVEQTVETLSKDYDYNRGILRGLTMAEDMAKEFSHIEEKVKDKSKLPMIGELTK